MPENAKGGYPKHSDTSAARLSTLLASDVCLHS